MVAEARLQKEETFLGGVILWKALLMVKAPVSLRAPRLSESQWLFGRVVALNPVQVRLKGGRVAFTWREIIADCQSRSPSPSPTSPRESRPSSPCLHPASLQANAISYSATINALEKGGQWQLAVNLLDSMCEANLPADVITYNTTISACEKGGQWQLAMHLFDGMCKANLPADVITYNATISACEKGGQWQMATHLFDQMCIASLPADAITYNATISACEKGGQWQLVLDLFDSMCKVNLSTDVISYTATISACEQGEQWQLAMHLFDSIRNAKLEVNVSSYSATISACEKGGQWQLAMHLFDIMGYSATISACEKGGEWQLAMRLLDSMRKANLPVDVITYNAAISVCTKGGQWLLALHLFDSMSKANLPFDVITCNAAIRACEQGEQWALAMHLFETMQKCKMSGSAVTYTAVLDAVCSQAQDHGYDLFLQARQAGLFGNLCKQGPALLDLLDMSASSAWMAVRWWLLEVMPPLLSQKPSYRGIIITGRGQPRPISHKADLRESILAKLRDHGLSAEVQKGNRGRLQLQLTTGELRAFREQQENLGTMLEAARRRARTLSRRRRRREKEMKEKELEMQQAVLTMLQRAKDDPRIPQAAEQVQQTKARALRDALDEVCREMEEYAEEMKQKAEAARAEKPKAKDAKASSKDAKNAKKKPAEAAKKEAKEAEKNEEDGDQEEPDEDDWNPLKALTRRKPARRPVEFKEASWAKVERLAKGLKGRGVKLRDLRLLTVKEREKLLKEHLGHPSGELPAPSEGNGKKEPPTVPLAAACPTDLDTFIQWLCEQLWLARIQRLSSPERRIGRKRPEQAGRPQKTLSARVGGGFIYETFQAPADFEEEPHSPAAASGPSRRRTTTPQVRNWECDRTISARVGGGFIYKTFQEGDYDNGKDDGDLKRMGHFQKSGHWLQAVEVMCLMVWARVVANELTLNTGISSFGSCVLWHQALHLLASFPAAKLRTDVISFNATTTACEKGTEWSRSFHLQSDLRGHRIRPDVISFNATITAAAKPGLWRSGLQLLSKMKRLRISPSVVTVNSILSAGHGGKEWGAVLWLLSTMPARSMAIDRIGLNAALSACAACAKWQIALHLLSGMPDQSILPDVVSISAAMLACVEGGCWTTALQLFADMPFLTSMPDASAYTTAISASEVGGMWTMAVQLLAEMAGCSLVPDTAACSASISACEQEGQWQAALLLLGGMPALKAQPNVISYSATISACAKGRQWTLALALLSEMEKRAVRANDVSYNAAISAVDKTPHWQVALELLSAMPKSEARPNVISFTAALGACSAASCWDVALHLLAQMQCQHVEPNALTVHAAIAACDAVCRWQVALKLLAGIRPSTMGSGRFAASCAVGAAERSWVPAMHAEDSPLDRVRKRVEEAAIAESDPKSLARLVQALSNWRMDLDALLCLPQEEFKRVAELLCVNMHGLTKEDVVEKLKKRVWANRTKFAKIKGLSKLAFEPKSQVLTELRKALREAEEQLQRPVTAFQLSGWLAQYQLEYYQLQINNLSLLTVAELRHLGDWMGMPPKKSRAEILEWFQQDLWSERAVRRTPSKAKTQFLRELSTARRRSVDEESAEEAEENQDDEADTATPTLSGILLDDPDFRMEYDMFVPVDT
eukprot:s722_g2.t4